MNRLMSRCHNFHCNGKIIINNFLLGTRGPLLSGPPWTLPILPTQIATPNAFTVSYRSWEIHIVKPE